MSDFVVVAPGGAVVSRHGPALEDALRASRAVPGSHVAEAVSGRAMTHRGRGSSHLDDAEDRPSPRERPPAKVNVAVALLRQALAGGPLTSAEVRSRAAAAGLRPWALRLARQQMGVVVARATGPSWTWALPDASGDSR